MDLTEFNSLVKGLRDPGVFGHPAAEVSVIETHISAVLLAGQYAYKIKKPVDFGFVDFSTLARRRHFCEEELRLNRRFAPELYLAVVAIRGNIESPTLAGRGPVVEYAVKMKRFDQEALLDRCIRRSGPVTGPMIEAFAGDVAAVHAGAARAAAESGYGTPERVAANLRECRTPVRDAGLLGAKAAIRGLFEQMEEQASALNPWFEQRLRDGNVRECHGDLHLGNLFLVEGRIRAFDCIEFNPGLRWIDVANDIAFTTMDLRFHGKAGFARRFRSAYLEACGDYSILRVLRFYEIYRALVRAKVAALREGEEPGAGMQDARDHLTLAAKLTGEAPAPSLVLTHGLSGSGKTFVSSRLLAASEAVRVRSDVERERCMKENAERYSPRNIDQVYQRLLTTAREILAAGHPAIVDATFLKRAHRDRFRKLADELNVPFRILHCRASKEELRRRVSERMRRGDDASQADLDVLDLQIEEREPLGEDERQFVVEYDAGGPFGPLWTRLGLGAAGVG